MTQRDKASYVREEGDGEKRKGNGKQQTEESWPFGWRDEPSRELDVFSTDEALECADAAQRDD